MVVQRVESERFALWLLQLARFGAEEKYSSKKFPQVHARVLRLGPSIGGIIVETSSRCLAGNAKKLREKVDTMEFHCGTTPAGRQRAARVFS